MSRMTWKQVEEYLKKRRDILIPLGSVEEHGYHAPLSTDSVIAEKLAEEISQKTGILVAPTIHYGVCIHTAAYTGTTSIKSETLKSLVRDVLSDLHRHGFKTFFILTGHAGTTQLTALREAGREMMEEKKGLHVYLLNPFEIDLSQIVQSKPFHADEAETSVMLYLMPELVDMEKAVGGKVREEKFEVPTIRRYTRSGAFGEPRLATREKGKKIFELWKCEFLKSIRSHAR